MTKDTGKITTREVYDLVDRKINEVNQNIASLENKVDSRYVTHEEFEPIKKVVYGLVGLILISVVGALIALVIVQ